MESFFGLLSPEELIFIESMALRHTNELSILRIWGIFMTKKQPFHKYFMQTLRVREISQNFNRVKENICLKSPEITQGQGKLLFRF